MEGNPSIEESVKGANCTEVEEISCVSTLHNSYARSAHGYSTDKCKAKANYIWGRRDNKH